jgi:3-hydroxyacyl-CoA dehydrogenase/enoyl-CoA hydratase/3-hydroxybutyryl-CoA epimerase
MRRAAELFARKLTDDRSRRRAWDRLMPDPDGCGRRRADLIIEAVPEQVELKQQVLGELDAQMRDDAILVTNTSSIVLQKLTGAVSRPERLAGLHFFNPVARMQLVEVVRHDDAGKDVLERLEGFVTDIDRLPVPVASSPGFLVNRVLTPYLLEAITLVDEGVPKETVDAAAESFGMPMGPIELADAIGLDICVDVAESLASELNEEMPPLPDWLRTLVTDGDLGRKTDKGLYEYQDGDALKNGIDEQTDDALVDRLMLPLIRSAVVSLAEGVVADADLLDGAIVFGTGFAPFRGGPIHFVRERGIEETGRALEALAGQHGSRFRPPARWSEVLTPR